MTEIAFAHQRFVRVDPVGVIIQTGETDLVAYMHMEELQDGASLRAITAAAPAEIGWLFDDASWTAAPRQPLAKTFDKTTVVVGGEDRATMAEVPAGTLVRVRGPITADATHEGGDLALGFTVAGTYEVTLEAFPAAATKFTLEVVE